MTSAWQLVELNNDDPQLLELLAFHRQQMTLLSPVENVHAIDVSQNQNQHLKFWGYVLDGRLCACAGLKLLNEQSGELKSMRTHPDFTRRNLAQQLLENVIRYCREQNITSIYLETGTAKAFEPAIALYEKFGFVACDAFADYKEDPHSCFFKLSV